MVLPQTQSRIRARVCVCVCVFVCVWAAFTQKVYFYGRCCALAGPDCALFAVLCLSSDFVTIVAGEEESRVLVELAQG